MLGGPRQDRGRSGSVGRISRASVGHDQEDRQMSESRRNSRRSPSRTFRPTFDGRLEERVLMTRTVKLIHVAAGLLKHTKPRAAFNVNQPPFIAGDAPFFFRKNQFTKIKAVGTQTARGGQNVEVTATDGSHYMITLNYTANTLATNASEGANGQLGAATSVTASQAIVQQSDRYPQPIGTVRAYPMSGGRVGIIVDGSTLNTELAINPLGLPQKVGFAHSFAYGESNRSHVLNVGQITINSGQIGAILGFQTTELSGPVVSNGTGAIDRIAFQSIVPGGSITVGGDVNTLDVLNGIDLSGAGTGIFIGRDLNLLNVGGNLTLSNGAVFSVGRNVGLLSQPPKGTGTGSNVLTLNFNSLQNTTITVSLPPSVGAFIQGNVIIDTANNSAVLIGNNIFNTFYVEGGVIGFSHFLVNTASTPKNPPFESTLPPAGVSPNGFVTALQDQSG
jgi:hypothetical protein